MRHINQKKKTHLCTFSFSLHDTDKATHKYMHTLQHDIKITSFIYQFTWATHTHTLTSENHEYRAQSLTLWLYISCVCHLLFIFKYFILLSFYTFSYTLHFLYIIHRKYNTPRDKVHTYVFVSRAYTKVNNKICSNLI